MEQLNFITNILGMNDKNIIILDYLDAGTHKEVISKLDYPASPASDFAQNISDILDGKEPNLTWTEQGVTLGVVVASEGYPLAYEKAWSCQKRLLATSSPTMQALSSLKMAKLCCQMAAVSTCWSPQQTLSKQPRTKSMPRSPNKTQTASFTEPTSAARHYKASLVHCLISSH